MEILRLEHEFSIRAAKAEKEIKNKVRHSREGRKNAKIKLRA